MRRSLIVTTLQHVASVSGLSRIEGFDFDRADMRENKNFAALFGDRHSYVHFGLLHACPFHLREKKHECISSHQIGVDWLVVPTSRNLSCSWTNLKAVAQIMFGCDR